MTTDAYLDFFEELAQASPLLDDIEANLRQSGQDGLAQQLVKIQQDAALEFEWSICGKEDVPPGPQTARLWEEYKEVTAVRLAVFQNITAALGDGNLKQDFVSLAARIPRAAEQSAPNILMTRDI